MKENVGLVDRMIRFVVAIIFIILGFMYSWWWFLPAAVALVTGLLGWCPIYAIFGISTNGTKTTKALPTPTKAAKKKKK